MSRPSGRLVLLLLLAPGLACHARRGEDPAPAPAAAVPPPDAAVPVDAAVAAVATPPDAPPADLFRRAIERMPAADRAAFAPVLARFERALATRDPDEGARLAIDAAGAFADAVLAEAARHPDDFAVQYEVGHALELLGPQITNLGGDGAPACTRALAFARTLARRFDREARAHAVLAFTSSACEDDDQLVLVEAARCVNLAADVHCRDLHARTLTRYQAPRCEGAAIAPDLGFYAASAAGAEREAAPSLTSADLTAITEAPSLVDGVPPESVAELSATGVEHLRALTTRAAARAGTLVVMRGRDVLLIAAVDHPMSLTRARLSRIPLDRVCVTTTRREVPEAARLR